MPYRDFFQKEYFANRQNGKLSNIRIYVQEVISYSSILLMANFWISVVTLGDTNDPAIAVLSGASGCWFLGVGVGGWVLALGKQGGQ